MNDAYENTSEEKRQIMRGMRALLAGNIEEARSQHTGVALLIDVLAEAMSEGSTPKMAKKRFAGGTEEDRRVCAGMLNLMESMAGQVKMVLAEIGFDLGDAHVEAVGGCGDPNCPNCHGASSGLPDDFADMLKKKVAEATGLDPDAIQVAAYEGDDPTEALETLMGKSAMRRGRRTEHTDEIMEALDRMPASRRPKLPPKKLPS